MSVGKASASGLAGGSNKDKSLSKAIGAAAVLTRFGSTTTYVVPAGYTTATFFIVSGGNGSGQNSAGAGGLGYSVTASVKPGETLTVTVGAGGGVGSAGQASTVVGSFGTLSSASGTQGQQYSTLWGWTCGNGGNTADTDSGFGNNHPQFGGGGTGSGHSGGGFFGCQGGHPNTGGGAGAGTVSSFWATPCGGGSGFVGLFIS